MVDDDAALGMRQEIETLVERLGPKDCTFLCDLPEPELRRLHMTYGMWLRNQFRRNEFPNLLALCSAGIPSENRSFDEISAVAMREIWLHLRSLPAVRLDPGRAP
jgi:hypothetical protein